VKAKNLWEDGRVKFIQTESFQGSKEPDVFLIEYLKKNSFKDERADSGHPFLLSRRKLVRRAKQSNN
jgi:hypothetical protein